MILSADALIYGGLVDSRTHTFTQTVLDWRLKRLENLRQNHPDTPLYVFATIMRSPRGSEGGMEPAYFEQYAADIFALAALQDKALVSGLTDAEQQTMATIRERIPSSHIKDWLERRQKNLAVNAKLIELTKQHKIDYLVLGRDDTSLYSRSTQETRTLMALAAGLSAEQFGSFPGADQLGMIMLTRAYNKFLGQRPAVAVLYPQGAGAFTLPNYEDQRIGPTINAHIVAAGGTVTDDAHTADLVLAVNTPLTGRTAEAGTFRNVAYVTTGKRHFVTVIAQHLQAGQKVALADITFANGADKALMKELSERQLLDKLTAYAGWNTASNALGYALGQGIMAASMSDQERKNLLAVRYLDDWAYQADIRQQLYREIVYPAAASSVDLKDLEPDITAALNRKLQLFNTRYLWLPPNTIDAYFPWNRLFEISVNLVGS